MEHRNNGCNEKKEHDYEEIIYGRNAVQEALRANASINKILFCGEQKGSMSVISAMAREKNVIMNEVG